MRILIAEDDKSARVILGGLLKNWGYEAVIVNDGRAAWNILQQPDAPALIILDWMMPEMNGLEVIEQVRAKFIEQPPYIILITSRGQRGDIPTGLEAGANDYIRKPFDYEELFARIRVGQRTLELQNSNYEARQLLAHLALYDALTGVLNRRGILEQLAKELARVQRVGLRVNDARLAVGFFDIDHFKAINDHFGHQVGDEVLKGIVGVISRQLRAYDILGRMGGDEFLVIAPETDEENSRQLFERLAVTAADSKIQTAAGGMSVTLSIGVISAGLNMDLETILDKADKAMYQAKRKGGNQVCLLENMHDDAKENPGPT